MKRKLLLTCLLAAAAVTSCDQYEDPPPPTATLPDVPLTQYDITGRWDGMSDQGRAIRFDARPSGNIVGTRLKLHHDCTGGQLVLNLNGFESKVNADSFSGTIVWRKDEAGGKYYVGTLTVSGTFSSDTSVSGAFINSITEKQADNLGVCGPASGTWEATKSE